MQNISLHQLTTPSPSPTKDIATNGLIIMLIIISINLIADIIPNNTKPIDNTKIPRTITIPSLNKVSG